MAKYLSRISTVLIILLGVLLFQKYSTTAMILIGGYFLYRAFTGTNRRAIRSYKLLKKIERNLKSLHGIEMSLQELTELFRNSQVKQTTPPLDDQYSTNPSPEYTPESPVGMEE